MTSREKILAAVRQNQPAASSLPPMPTSTTFDEQPLERFETILTGIGGRVIHVADLGEVSRYVEVHYPHPLRVITTLPELAGVAETNWTAYTPHGLADVELAIIRAHFGVVENGAVWLTEALLGQGDALVRAVPFIPQHLAVVLNQADLVPTMHHAYARIGHENYNYGVFVAGPSKTADIEQSLVLGAHGPKTMTVFLVSL